MPASTKKWISRLIKFAVCAGALWYLSSKVTLDDYVRLAESPDKRHLLLSEGAISETTVVLRIRDLDTGVEREVARAALAKQEELTPDQRPIELGLKTVVREGDWAWGRFALLVMGPVPFIIAVRLRWLLAAQEIALSYRDALLLTFAGNFFNFAMPGTTGGDIYKAYHITKRTRKRTEGITVVLLDRVVGLLSFLFIAAAAIFAARGTEVVGVFGRYVGYLLLALIVGGVLFFSRRLRRLIRYDRWLAKLPLADKIRRIDETAFSFRYHRWLAAVSLLITLISHGLIVTSIYFLARSLGIHPSAGRGAGDMFLAVLISTVVGYLFAAIPISVQGFGLLEAVFYKVMVGGLWCNPSQMLALTLGARLVQIVWSLPGVFVPWLGMERPALVRSAEAPQTNAPAPQAD